MTRRRFVGTTIGGTVALMTGGSGILRAATSTTPGGTFSLGGDLNVNRMGFGAMRITGDGVWGWPSDRANAVKVLKRAVDLGVNFIDTADVYGPETSELLIAEALHPYPKGLVIATKGGLTRPGPGSWEPNGKPDYLTQCVEKSLKRLKLDRIDLWQLHRIDRKVPVEESLGAIKKLVDQGKIRHVGLSEVTAEEIQQANKVVPIVSIQNRYNITDRKSDAALEYCEKNKLGFIPWAPVGSGKLARGAGALAEAAKKRNVSEAQLALAWLLQRSPVMLPIPGTQSVAHLEENMKAADLKLTAQDWKEIEREVGKA